jgi:hypothetical protein
LRCRSIAIRSPNVNCGLLYEFSAGSGGGVVSAPDAAASDSIAGSVAGKVEMSSFQLPVPPDDREGILICNGHAHPFVEPAMEGWFKEQLRDHGRTFRFMHLDDVVGWIDSQRLYSTFRRACSDLGISTA